jgi:hypothetical protein
LRGRGSGPEDARPAQLVTLAEAGMPVGNATARSLPLLFLIAASVLASACGTAATSSTPAPTPMQTPADTARITGPNPGADTFGNSLVTVAATPAGVSEPFTVTGGTYDIQYLIDAGTDTGCDFSLLLTPRKDGPIIQSSAAILTNGKVGSREDTWTIPAGTYVLQEDETGLSNCRRGFHATVTAHN